MLQTQVKMARNQSIECARMVAALFVVFIHCNFPGELGGYVGCIGRFAVPMFFAISGYYGYRASEEKIRGRMKGILKLYLSAVLLYLFWNLFRTEYSGGSSVAYLRAAVPEIDEVARFLFLNVPPYVGHLWYLLAMATCYLVFWIYTCLGNEKEVDYRPLYIVSVCLLAGNFVMGAIMQYVETDSGFVWCRTGWFTGIPMFTLGIFLREHQQEICTKFSLTARKELLLFFAGVILSLIQWRGGIESGTMEFGTVIGTVGLMLFLTSHPMIVKTESLFGKCISHFGFLSMVIYIAHLLVLQAYELLLAVPMERLLGPKELWLRPILVLGLSIAAAVLWDCVYTQLKRLSARRQ